jgi:hypothetical protein
MKYLYEAALVNQAETSVLLDTYQRNNVTDAETVVKLTALYRDNELVPDLRLALSFGLSSLRFFSNSRSTATLAPSALL